jgi:hypothetical protein
MLNVSVFLPLVESPLLILHIENTSHLTGQVRSISEVTKAAALGDLGKLVNIKIQGEMLDLKMTIDSMVS